LLNSQQTDCSPDADPKENGATDSACGLLSFEDVYPPCEPEILVDFNVSPRFPSRYQVLLLEVSRFGATIEFAYRPSMFRPGIGYAGSESCGAEVWLVARGRTVVRVSGHLSIDAGPSGTTARVRFGSPLALPDYAALRRYSERVAEEAAEEPTSEPIVLEPDQRLLDEVG
jgi:hypothetical protein